MTGDTATGAIPRRVIETGNATAIRFAVMARVPMKATHGMLLADRAHEKAGIALRQAGIPETRRQETMGTGGAATDHAHTPWIALPDSKERGASVRNLIQAAGPIELGTVAEGQPCHTARSVRSRL